METAAVGVTPFIAATIVKTSLAVATRKLVGKQPLAKPPI